MKSNTHTLSLQAFLTGTLFVVFIWAASIAQAPDTLSPDEISDEDLQNFLAINTRMLQLQEDAMMEVEEYIQQQGMTPQRYAEIAASENNVQGESDATDEELATAKEISEYVQQVNMRLEQQAQEVIEKEGLTMTQYQAIGAAIEGSPELQTRLNDMMNKEMQ